MNSHKEPGNARRRPISTHKAFAPIVALWFAALLGLGSMVLPVAQIERLVLTAGISKFIPMIAPPLDLTGRAIVAVVLALLGGAIGQVVARRLSMVHATQSFEDADGEARAPISAFEELGDADAEDEAPRRSRRLAIEHEAQDEQVIEFAPLPVAMMPDSEVVEEVVETEVIEPAADENDDLELVEEEIAAQGEPVLVAMDVAEPALGTWDQEPDPQPEYEDAPLSVEPFPEAEPELVQAEQITPVASPYQGKPLEELGLFQLVERLGASMHRHRAMRATAAPVAASTTAVQPALDPELPEDETCDDVAEVAAFDPETSASWFEAGPESTLATAEYASDADREIGAIDVPVSEVKVDVVEAEIEDVTEELVPGADPEPQTASANPFALFASFTEEDDEEELATLASSFRLPIGNTAASHQHAEDDGEDGASSSAFVDDEDEYDVVDEHEDEHEAEDEEEGEDDNEVYGSLLSLRRPFPPKPVEEAEGQESSWINEEQVEAEEAAVNAPAAASPGPEIKAHERALRDALLSLQRLDRAG